MSRKCRETSGFVSRSRVLCAFRKVVQVFFSKFALHNLIISIDFRYLRVFSGVKGANHLTIQVQNLLKAGFGLDSKWFTLEAERSVLTN